MVRSSRRRVTANTADHVNHRLVRETEERIAYYAEHPEMIDARLEALDREWDIERTLQANAASITFAGVALGALADRRWLVLPAAVAAFLFQHAVQGWCPPLPVLRRMGFRTTHEIDRERVALKLMRGDFAELAGGLDDASPLDALAAARR